jgi:ParB/RepB/Spo0J family partition protein
MPHEITPASPHTARSAPATPIPPDARTGAKPDARAIQAGQISESPVLLNLDSLTPHPANPRIVEREDVIASIEQQIRASGFDPSHAILVRPLGAGYQIISGHNRTTAARRAGLVQIPAWVREMDNDAAFMQLLLSNAQGELSPLERGMHALAATEKGKHGRSIRAYAEQVGRPERTIYNEVQAAEVAKVCPQGQISALIQRSKHLCEIHAAPVQCWLALATRLVEHGWTVEETKAAVKAVLAVKAPRGYEQLFAVERLQQMAAAGQDPSEVTRLSVRAIERARADIRDVQFAVEDMPPSSNNGLLNIARGTSGPSRKRRERSLMSNVNCARRAKQRSQSSNAR